MLKKYINIIKQKKGMSLVEVMTAMTILTLMIFCFAPLFLSYFNSIDIAGKKLDEVYYEAGIMQRVIGNINKSQTQDSNGYITPFQKIPLTLTSSDGVSIIKTDPSKDTNGNLVVGTVTDGGKSIGTGATIKTKAADSEGQLTDISGGLLLSNPNNMDDSLMTVYANSIDAGFYCYPNSITDDFIKKDIIVIAKGMAASCSGFEVFVNVDQTTVSKNADLYEGYNAKYGGKLKGDKDGNKSITEGVSWSIEPLEGVSDVFVLTVYGGKGISFETSPLIIKYGTETKAVEVDAPMMIMVGEANENGEYNYYVSRGEVVDPDGDGTADTLAILQRTMRGDTPLTSAMNDVEWVDEESADSYTDGKKIDGTKYGYYVMCGDEGQVRRFWRNADVLTTDSNGNQTVKYGNYYWGGDYTYYTDYNLNRFTEGNMHINTTDANGNASTSKVLSTDVSFKFIAMRPMMWESGNVPDEGLFGKKEAENNVNKYRTGFNMSSKKYQVAGIATTGIATLRNLCTVSATYADQIQFYASDGQLWSYIPYDRMGGIFNASVKKAGDDSGVAMPSYSFMTTINQSADDGGTYNDHPVKGALAEGLKVFSNEAWGWMDPGDGTNSYYKIYGLTDSSGNPTVNTKSYPITLTSVDAIQLSGSGAYESNVTDTSKTHYFVSGVMSGEETSGDATGGTNASQAKTVSTNLSYATSNYVLYCGYIPAYMDAWGGTSGNATYAYSIEFAGDNGQYAKKWDSSYVGADITNSMVGRASNRLKISANAEYNTVWRMTMGVAPIIKTGSKASVNETAAGTVVYSYKIGTLRPYYYPKVLYYPYTNIEYAITGKYYDLTTYENNRSVVDNLFSNSVTIGSPKLLTSPANSNQNNASGGKVVDITLSYLSHPLAISIAANPTDHIVYDLSNNKGDRQAFYWHNRRESITFLDSASTVVPNGEKDVPVSLMVGYVLGGVVAYGKSGREASVDITSVMNNGIVFLRAGNSMIERQGNGSNVLDEAISEDSANSKTSEFMALDKDGYMLAQESNVFHQFYYLNSRAAGTEKPTKGKSIGNIYGAQYWQNNRHIIPRSILGGAPAPGDTSAANNYEYLRAHPLTDTKVTCVAWGTTWNGNPEAMWGTENGTVLSWWVDTQAAAQDAGKNSSNYNDSVVAAEIQSYKWIDTASGKTFSATNNNNTVGAAGESFHVNTPSSNYKTFFDKATQQYNFFNVIGFINTLENINDIEFADDIWVAVGDQSDRDPADYCASGVYAPGNGNNPNLYNSNGSSIGENPRYNYRAYGDANNNGKIVNTGRGGSWVNVRYWVDISDGNNGFGGKQSNDNSIYHWKAVQITKEENCNIVQINNVNGMWIATGYKDANNNDEYDTGEKPIVCWAYDPLIPCGLDASLGGWSDKVEFYKEGATSATSGILDKSLIGGINSCATRS